MLIRELHCLHYQIKSFMNFTPSLAITNNTVLTKYAHVWTRGTGCCTELPYKADNPDANNTSNWLVWIWGRSWLRSLIMTSAALECSQPTTNCFCSEHRLTHPWEGKSKPTQLPSGTAKPCYSHKHITHPLCQLWSQQWTATATGTLVCPWCSKLTSFFRFSLTRSPTSAVREEALLAQTPRFTRDFTPTHSLLHIRPQKKKKNWRQEDNSNSSKGKV